MVGVNEHSHTIGTRLLLKIYMSVEKSTEHVPV